MKTDEQIQSGKILTEMRKMNEEMRKFIIEARKLEAETVLTSNKAKWYETTMAFIGVVAGATILAAILKTL